MFASFIHSWLVPLASAQVFNDPGGLSTGLTEARNIQGIETSADLRGVILNILITVLNFLALVAVVAIVAAGIYLVAGGGTETSKETAKKIILYVIIGLVVVLFARLIVAFFLNAGNFTN